MRQFFLDWDFFLVFFWTGLPVLFSYKTPFLLDKSSRKFKDGNIETIIIVYFFVLATLQNDTPFE